MAEIRIEQALYGSGGPGGYRFLARSPGFAEEWLAEAERLCTGFGERPAGVACPRCVFARPLGREHVAVVQAADWGADDAGRPGALGFCLLVLARRDYAALTGDPFLIADRHPPPWQVRHELPTLTWEGGPPPRRTAADVQRVLQRPAGPSLVPGENVPRGGSHVMLGGCQVLVDSGRLVFERPAPDTDLLRDLWTLLPSRVRCDLWPASFAFGNALHFDAVVVPRYNPDDFPGYRTEVQAADYPEGKYEYSLQHAAETGNQDELDALFNRRSSRETFRLVVALLVVVLVLAAVIRLLPITPPPPTRAKPPATAPQEHGAIDLPPPGAFPALGADERDRLTAALRRLAEARGANAPPDATAEQLLAALDHRLGTPDPRRDPGPLADQGPVQRQLRALLWKHGVAAYSDPRLNSVELVERLDSGPARAQRR